MKNKKPCGPIFSEEQRLVLLNGFQKQSTYTTVAEYAKANNVKKSTLKGWSVRYKIPLGYHHRKNRKPLPKEQKIALLDGFQKQNTHTTITDYAKANNVSVKTFFGWSVLYGMPLGGHHSRPIFSKEQRIALLDGFQKQNTHTTLADYAKANNVNKPALFKWSVLYGMPLGWHHRNHRKALPKEKKIALLDGFQKQNTYTTAVEYAKAHKISKSTLNVWSVLYGMPLGWHHSRPIFSEEKKIALLEGFQKQKTHTTVAEYAKAKNVNKSSLRGWSVRYGIPLGHHHRNHRKPLPKEQKLAILEGFQKQNTHTTIAEYAKANNVSRPALCKWSIYYRIPLGNHYTRRIQQTPYGRAISTALANRRSGDGA